MSSTLCFESLRNIAVMIRSRNNPQVRTIRRLRNAHARRRIDLLLLEGPHLVEAGAEAGLEFHHLLVTPEFGTAHVELIRRLEDRSGTAATPIDPDRLLEQADTDAPQGIAALVDPPPNWHSAEDETLVLTPGLHLYLDGIQDPGNLGAIARSTEAAGAASLLLAPGTARPSQPRALRASAGSLLRLPLWTDVSINRIPPGVPLLALTVQRTSKGTPPPTKLLFSIDDSEHRLLAELISTDAILAVGSESKGLSGLVLDRAEALLSIPTAPAVESLNVAVAASLALFELQRLRHTK
ncbi:MAG: RNA methyltransferase [Acidobacteria bacterium]|nr:RNA methyltransferase [Acidobacteriota bacterium]